jgi:anthranilate synthase component 1
LALAAPTLSLARSRRAHESSDATLRSTGTRSKHDHRSRIPRPRRAGLQPHPPRRESFADLDTPLSLYLKLANARYSFLLESVVGGERFGRYSFIGLPAQVRFARAARASRSSTTTACRRRSTAIRSRSSSVPRALQGGAAAGLAALSAAGSPASSATTSCATSRRSSRTGKPPTPGLAGVPDLLLLLTEELAVVDNLKGKISLIVYADPAAPDAYRRTRERLVQLRRKLREPVAIPLATGSRAEQPQSEFGETGYKAAVSRAKEYIVAGDIMQVVISQRMTMPFEASPLSLYRALRSLNPSPYMFYYDFGDFHVVGASPEILVRKEGSTITLRPIAGTRPRGATRDLDEALAKELAADPKDSPST